jgi:hypothetical protein
MGREMYKYLKMQINKYMKDVEALQTENAANSMVLTDI